MRHRQPQQICASGGGKESRQSLRVCLTFCRSDVSAGFYGHTGTMQWHTSASCLSGTVSLSWLLRRNARVVPKRANGFADIGDSMRTASTKHFALLKSV